MIKVLESNQISYRRGQSNKDIRRQVKANTGFEVRRMDNFTLVAIDAVFGLFEQQKITGRLGLYGVAQYFSVELLQQLLIEVKAGQDVRPIDFISTVGNAANYYLAKLFNIHGPNLFIGASEQSDRKIKMLAASDLQSGAIDYAIVVQWQENEDFRLCCAELVINNTKN